MLAWASRSGASRPSCTARTPGSRARWTPRACRAPSWTPSPSRPSGATRRRSCGALGATRGWRAWPPSSTSRRRPSSSRGSRASTGCGGSRPRRRWTCAATPPWPRRTRCSRGTRCGGTPSCSRRGRASSSRPRRRTAWSWTSRGTTRPRSRTRRCGRRSPRAWAAPSSPCASRGRRIYWWRCPWRPWRACRWTSRPSARSPTRGAWRRTRPAMPGVRAPTSRRASSGPRWASARTP
mmetsp:Transcript_8331/g.25026  ORF Transcript_8331/g.25026 Transcript_8331/m.25026 type:complete len:237 (-) Transcript_8331:155-865(-)